MKHATLIVVMVVGLLLLVGCGAQEQSAEKAPSTAPAVEEKVSESPAPVQATGKIHQVVIENFKFMPTNLEVKVGDTIEWVNKDSTQHTATFENGDVDEKLNAGATTTYVVTEKGEFPYFCQFHPDMRASVIVS